MKNNKIVAELNTIHERGEADARLIAAAPELLTFAYFVAAWLTAPELNRTTLDAVQRQARAAIAKATGTP